MLGTSRWKLFTMPGHVAIDSKIESNSDAITSNQKASLKIAGAISIEATGTTDPNSIVSKWKDSAYRFGRSPDWLKMKNADAPAVKREAEEDWGR